MTRFPFAIVRSLSKIDEYDEWTMSLETIGSSVYWRIPSKSPVSAFARKSSLTSSVVGSEPTWTTRSTIEPVGTGARIDMPSTLPFRSGSTTPIARAAPVEVGMRLIAAARARRRSLCGRSSDLLVVRVRVDRGHEAALDPVRLVQDLGDRRDAVGRAGGVRDDVVLLRVVLAVVDAEDDGEVGIGGRSGDDDLLRARLQVLLGVVGRFVKSPVDSIDDVDAEIAPGKVGRVALGEELDLVAVDGDRVRRRLRRGRRGCRARSRA